MIILSKVKIGTYFEEAQCGFTPRTAMEEAARCLLCYDSPCSKGCPAGTDPAKFIRSIRFRNVKGAAETIRENNVMGGSCAMVCPYDRMCEEACSRCGIDKPIEIGRLQRFAMEQEAAFGMKILVAPEEKKAGKVACIGSGPASLTCAAELAKAGYEVTVFEAMEKAGGVLTYGINYSRLPQEVVDRDIQAVTDLGVEIVCGCKVDAKKIEELKADGYVAFFVGAGLWAAKLPDIEGANLAGVKTAVDFLKDARVSGGKADMGKKVIVIGGGNVAMDCALSAKLMGAEHVAIWYRRTIEEAPADIAEIEHILSLGIPMTTNFAPDFLEGDGKVEFMHFKGRDGVSSAKVQVDTVVFAIGQAPEEMAEIAEFAKNPKGGLVVDESGKTNLEGFFAAGDIVNGGKTVVEAVAGGKAAAVEMIAYLEKR